MLLTRRRVLGWGTLLTAGAAVNFGVLSTRRPAAATGFGVLRSDPKGVLDLIDGFSYQVLQHSGDAMSDGTQVKTRPDGMAAFTDSQGRLVLMRNHELPFGRGGVSRVVMDKDSLAIISSNQVIDGTSINCAGGPSPWGWLTCEEVTGEGGVWVCPVETSSVLKGNARRRVDGYGTFRHEAVCIDPDSLRAYLTEDEYDGALYRFVPLSRLDPFRGQLQAMSVPGKRGFDTAAMQQGQSVRVDWVDVSSSTTHDSARAAGAAIVNRAEGCWWFEGSVYFTATSNGQVFRLTPNGDASATLTLLTRSLHMPDNITVAPSGHLYVAEDNSSTNHIHIVTSSGEVHDFARNALNPGDEFAGVCFSPDGRTLFANMQNAGLTLAIRGPFAHV